MQRDRFRATALAAMASLLVACGGGDPETGGPAPGQSPGASAGSVAVAAPSGPVDEVLAERGEALFREKGCVACHTIGKGRLTGPDLAGVGERREWPWILQMVTSPDSMLRSDPVARQLMAEYMTPMPDLGVSPDEVRAIYEHIREESAEDDEDDDS